MGRQVSLHKEWIDGLSDRRGFEKPGESKVLGQVGLELRMPSGGYNTMQRERGSLKRYRRKSMRKAELRRKGWRDSKPSC